jgi:hypothetical protein
MGMDRHLNVIVAHRHTEAEHHPGNRHDNSEYKEVPCNTLHCKSPEKKRPRGAIPSRFELF